MQLWIDCWRKEVIGDPSFVTERIETRELVKRGFWESDRWESEEGIFATENKGNLYMAAGSRWCCRVGNPLSLSIMNGLDNEAIVCKRTTVCSPGKFNHIKCSSFHDACKIVIESVQDYHIPP